MTAKNRTVPTTIFVALALTCFLIPRFADAVYQCDGETDDCQCAANNPYPCCDNGGGNFGNCTWWAWNSACCNWAVGLPGWGNANTWAPNAQAHAGYNVVGSPVIGSIAASDQGTWGHVAWVTAINGSQITVTEMNCCAGCNNGARSWNYQASWFNQGFIVRSSCACSPNDTDTRSCGNCGTETRTCQSDCQWGSWSGCTGEGPCADGQSDSQACGDCGTETRTCQPNCQWGAWSACDGPDPGGGTQPCDTGLAGECSQGVHRCVSGLLECEQTVFSVAESCDGLDNDCDNQTDEDGICGGADASISPDAAPPGVDGSVPAVDGSTVTPDASVPPPGVRDVTGGCTCRTTRSSSPIPLLWICAAFVLCMFRRRRRSR